MSEKITKYDYKNAFKEDGIDEHIQEIFKYCKLKKIPFFASFAISNSDEGTEYDNYTVSAGLEDINLKEDKIRKHILLYRGFDVAPIGAMNIDHDEDLDSYLNDADFDLD